MKSLHAIMLVLSTGILMLQNTAFAGQPLPGALRVVVIGDSTVSNYPADSTERGWGQMLNEYFAPGKVQVLNLAVGGRSSKSFLNEKRWQKILDMTSPPDYVLIQFGHNDNPGKPPEAYTSPDPVPATLPAEGVGSNERDWYRNNLRTYITQAREIGATPILITPMERHYFDKDAHVRLKNKPYADAALDVAKETNTLVIDLHQYSVDTYNKLGLDGSASLHYRPNPDHLDNTHYSEAGARLWAAFIADKLQQDVRLKPLVVAPAP